MNVETFFVSLCGKVEGEYDIILNLKEVDLIFILDENNAQFKIGEKTFDAKIKSVKDFKNKINTAFINFGMNGYHDDLIVSKAEMAIDEGEITCEVLIKKSKILYIEQRDDKAKVCLDNKSKVYLLDTVGNIQKQF